jgi:hypothetical protein
VPKDALVSLPGGRGTSKKTVLFTSSFTKTCEGKKMAMPPPPPAVPPKKRQEKEQEIVRVEEFAHREHIDAHAGLRDAVSRVMEDSSSFGELCGEDVMMVITQKPRHIKHKGWRLEVWANVKE